MLISSRAVRKSLGLTLVKADLRIDSGVFGQLNARFPGREAKSTFKAGRPACRAAARNSFPKDSSREAKV